MLGSTRGGLQSVRTASMGDNDQGASGASLLLTDADWRTWMNAEIQRIKPTLKHTPFFSDFISDNASSQIDWEIAAGAAGVGVFETARPGGHVSLFTSSTGATQQAVRFKSNPLPIKSQLRNEWAMGARVFVGTDYANAGTIALLSCACTSSVWVNLGVLSSVSAGFLTIWTSNGANGATVVDEPQVTNLPIPGLLGTMTDLALVYDGISTEAFSGQWATNLALSSIGLMQANLTFNDSNASFWSWIATSGANCSSQIDAAMCKVNVSF